MARYPGPRTYTHQYGNLKVTVQSRNGIYLVDILRPSDGYTVGIETPERTPMDAARYALHILVEGLNNPNLREELKGAAEELGQDAADALAENAELSGRPMDREFWEEAKKKPAPCWGVGKEGEPCDHCKRLKKGKIGCGRDCACGCSMKGATMGLHTAEERDGAIELARRAIDAARRDGSWDAWGWAYGYLQALVDLALQEGADPLAATLKEMARGALNTK